MSRASFRLSAAVGRDPVPQPVVRWLDAQPVTSVSITLLPCLRDTIIAGIVKSTGRTLGTCNLSHFDDLSASLINPW
jgi:predicted nucleic acid-binding protein